MHATGLITDMEISNRTVNNHGQKIVEPPYLDPGVDIMAKMKVSILFNVPPPRNSITLLQFSPSDFMISSNTLLMES